MSEGQGGGTGLAGGLFSPRVVLGLVLVGVLSFAALLVFGAYAPDSQGKDNPGEHAFSRAAIGYAGLVELLKQSGRTTVVARGPVVVDRPAMIVLTLDGGDPKQELGALPTTRGFKGPILAVLPKWNTAADGRNRAWTRKRGVADVPAKTWIGDGSRKGEQITLGHGTGVGPRRLRWLADGHEMATGPIDRLQVFTRITGWTPLIVDANGNAVLARKDFRDEEGALVEGDFYALSEPDLLNNQGIASLATARAGVAALNTVQAGPDPTVIFDVTLNGLARSRSLLKLAFEPPFLAATLAAFAAALLAGWSAWIRFGAERRQGRVFALGKRALADNQAGLIRMAGREPRMAVPYVQVVRDLVARAVGAPKTLTPQALDAFLDRVSEARRAQHRISTLAAEAPAVATPHDLSRLAQRLYDWRLEMTLERH